MSEPFVGEIRMFAGTFAPQGWAFCEGQLLSIPQNDALFSLLGTVYGGDGRTTFGLPDLRGRVPIHAGSGPGLTPRQLGSKAGTENVTLTTAQLPSHTHPIKGSTNTATATDPAGNVPAQSSTIDLYVNTAPTVNMNASAVAGTGGSRSHNNLMPTLCVNFIIALFGIYPSRQ
jgi:microcystin-dependent protein